MQMTQLYMATETFFASFETDVNSNLRILNSWFEINKLFLNLEEII